MIIKKIIYCHKLETDKKYIGKNKIWKTSVALFLEIKKIIETDVHTILG